MNGQPAGGSGKKMNVLFAAVVGVILLIASFLVGLTVGMKSEAVTREGGVGCDEAALIQRLINSGYLPPDVVAAGPVYSLSGAIAAVDEDGFDVTASLSPIDAPATYRVTVDSDTKLVMLTRKDAEEFDSEMLAFERAMETFDPETDTLPEPPNPFEEKTVKLSDLRQGMRVSVASDSDMRVSLSFVATEVRAEEPPATPEPATEPPPVEEPLLAPPAEEPPVEEPPAELPPVEEPPVE